MFIFIVEICNIVCLLKVNCGVFIPAEWNIYSKTLFCSGKLYWKIDSFSLLQ